MNNEQVMQLLADNGLHEGGMDNWVLDNAWVQFANLVAAHEREECAKIADEWDKVNKLSNYGAFIALQIRARGTT